MSLILDALRKMEQDRKSRRGAAQDIRPEVLRYRGSTRPLKTRSYLPATLGVALLLLCGVGAALLLKGHRAANVPAEAVSATPAASGNLDRQDTPVQPATALQPATAVQPVPPVQPVTPALPALPDRVVVRGAPAPAAVPETAPRVVSEPARREPVRPAQPKSVHRDTPAVTQPAPADITITGIAWQDERSLRRAVVNGALVGEGAEVAGARVVEIREDRVRLSRGGQVFDAMFSSGFAR
jgi:general secretion pathway protein B